MEGSGKVFAHNSFFENEHPITSSAAKLPYFQQKKMHYRQFGKTGLHTSAIGFGAWAIGGPAMAGNTPIGWSNADDRSSIAAIHQALDSGINFFDTADFYGFGHSEDLLGQNLRKLPEALIATKVGHRLNERQEIYLDYSKNYILEACEASLRRLRRNHIDFYQLHAARLPQLENGECLEAMELLRQQGKIRYWGLSLNTFNPTPEADWLIERGLGDGFQVVLNILNQRGLPAIRRAGQNGYGVIVRMPLQFGLLTGKFNADTRFPPDDHRAFRLPPDLLADALEALEPVWPLCEKYKTDPAGLAMGYALSFPEVSTVIPGIRTPEQAIANTMDFPTLKPEDIELLARLFETSFDQLVQRMK